MKGFVLPLLRVGVSSFELAKRKLMIMAGAVMPIRSNYLDNSVSEMKIQPLSALLSTAAAAKIRLRLSGT